jgi:hypothetical protein
MPEKLVRMAGHDAIEVRRMAFGHQHAFASAGGTAREVRVICGLAVVLSDDLLGEPGHPADSFVGEVEGRLLFAHEAGVET